MIERFAAFQLVMIAIILRDSGLGDIPGLDNCAVSTR